MAGEPCSQIAIHAFTPQNTFLGLGLKIEKSEFGTLLGGPLGVKANFSFVDKQFLAHSAISATRGEKLTGEKTPILN